MLSAKQDGAIHDDSFTERDLQFLDWQSDLSQHRREEIARLNKAPDVTFVPYLSHKFVRWQRRPADIDGLARPSRSRWPTVSPVHPPRPPFGSRYPYPHAIINQPAAVMECYPAQAASDGS